MTARECNPGRGVRRRRFLTDVGAAAVTFSVVRPSLAWGTQANSKIEVGVIGLGGRGHWIANLVREHGGYEITAVADYFETVAETVGEQLGVPGERRFHGLSGYRRLLEAGVDAVFLETPPYCFPDHVAAAVQAGCHVYMAKPVACDVPGCLTVREMAAKATRANKLFLIDFQTRTHPLIREGIGRLHRGEIGKVALLDSIYADEGFSDPPQTGTIESRLQHLIWVNDVNLGGGMLVNAGIHMVDVALWMSGERTPICAVGGGDVVKEDPHGDTHYVYSLTYEFEDGLLLNHRGDHLRNGTGFKTQCVAYCQSGLLETSYEGAVRMPGSRGDWQGGEVKGHYRQGAVDNIATFHRDILEGNFHNPTVHPGINATLTTILGREAAQQRRKITMNEILQENRKLEVDFTGLQD